MRALATNIGDGEHCLSNFALHIQVPLLNVRPDSPLGYGWDTEREKQWITFGIVRFANVFISRNIRLGSRQHEWRRSFQRLCSNLVPICMLEEDTVAAPDRHSSRPSEIVGKTNPGSEIKQMVLHAAGRNTVDSTSNHPGHLVNVASWREHQRPRVRINRRRGGTIVGIGVEVIGAPIALTVGAEKADAQAQIEGETSRGAPIVLEIGLDNLIPVVILDLATGLRKTGNLPSEQVGEWIVS